MKSVFRFIIAVVAIAGNLDAQVAPKSKVKQILLEYKSPNKTIEIKDTYFTVSDKKDSFSNPVSSIPSSSTYEDKNYTLTKKEVYDLIKFIEDNNFFDLDPAYGAPEGERNYPTTLFIKMHGKEKEVIYRSNPSYESAPEIFRRIEEYILKLRK
ncbi:MAG: hypothetical protein IPQ05_13315 [Leptospiraceae bacterium]|nr:hypothetical protein [Leptospiraceae bacterium]